MPYKDHSLDIRDQINHQGQSKIGLLMLLIIWHSF